jgi:hypothetical protein
MRPKDAKVWNEALVQALQAREQMARRAGKRTHILWREGWQKLQTVRADIYTFKNGRIVNFPTNLKKTVDNLLRSIIAGTEPILPRGYVPYDANAANSGAGGGNPYLNDPYLNSIKKRGGAFAILMAFHQSDQVLTKDQICELAQPYCDTEMQENFRAGRARGAWAAITTLQSHDLVSVQQRAVAYNERAGGMRSLGKNSYMLTPNGRLFLQALLEKNPDIVPPGGRGVAARANPYSSNLIGDYRHLMPEIFPPDIVGDEYEPWPELFPTSPTTVSLDQVKSSPPRPFATFADGTGHTLESPNAKRRLNFPPPREAAALAALERQAIQESIRMAEEGDKKPAATPKTKPKAATKALPKVQNDSFLTKHSTSSPNSNALKQKASVPQNGHSTKKQASKSTAIAPSTAPMIDLTESQQSDMSMHQGKTPLIVLDMEDDPPALVSTHEIWDLTDSQPMELFDDDDDVVEIPEATGVAVLPSPGCSALPLTSLVIYIDDRERNRNDTPRALRLELSRLLTGNVFTSIWPSHLEPPSVEERRLPVADFAFGGAATNETDFVTFPIALERKRIGDIVNRSTKKDHWYQLQRMQDEAVTMPGGIAILMLEGDPRTTEKFTPFGAQSVDTASPYVHTIDDEETLYRYMGRSILNGTLQQSALLINKGTFLIGRLLLT